MRNSSSVISRKPKRKKKLDFVQDFLPIKDIHYGVIETKKKNHQTHQKKIIQP